MEWAIERYVPPSNSRRKTAKKEKGRGRGISRWQEASRVEKEYLLTVK
jgi:hypothetical protein